MFWFFYKLSETIFILRRTERDMIKYVIWSSCKVPLFLSGFNEIEMFSAHFRKYLNIKFHKNPSGGSRVLHCGQTDRHDETNFENSLKRWAVQENDIWNHSYLVEVSSDREPSWTLPVTQITRSTVYRTSSHREAQWVNSLITVLTRIWRCSTRGLISP